MPRRTLVTIGSLLLAAGAVWYAAFRTGHGASVDARVLAHLSIFQGTRAEFGLNSIAFLCNPAPYAVLVLMVVAAGLVRFGPRGAVVLGVVLVGANALTQMLKDVLAEDRVPGSLTPQLHVDPSSWPSGHATASLTLALCALLCAPRASRPLVAGLGAVFVGSVSLAVVALGWHFPSDVLGGWLIGAAAVAAGSACLPEPVPFSPPAARAALALRSPRARG